MERELWCELCDLINELAYLAADMPPSRHQDWLLDIVDAFDAFVDLVVELRLHHGAANTYEGPMGQEETGCDG